MSDQIYHILVVARDASLPKELQAALSELPEARRFVLQTETDVRRGVEHAVDRTPHVVCLELGPDTGEAQRIAAEIAAGSADTLVVGFYRPEEFGGSDALATTLVQLMRTHVRDFVRRPVSSTELEALFRRHLAVGERKVTTRGRVISFISNKGGVGKTTLSLNVACRLARQRPDRVLLIDAALQHGADCELLGLRPEATLRDAALQIERLDERLLRVLSTQHPSGLRVLAAPANAIEAAAVSEQAMARILSVARRSFDYVVVDTFPLIDSTTIAILDLSDSVFVTLNSFVPSVLGVSELLGVLGQLGVPDERIRVVLNHTHPSFRGSLRGVDVADRLGHDIDFVVPYSRNVMTATNSGTPYVLRGPRWRGFPRSIRAIERQILASGPVAPGAAQASVSSPEEAVAANGVAHEEGQSAERVKAKRLQADAGETS